MKNDIELLYPKINHYALKHPISQESTSVEQFNFDAFQKNPKVVLSGYWLRRHKLFYEWNSPLKKIHLLKRYSLTIMDQEYKASGSTFEFSEQYGVEQVSYLPNDEYDALLQSSILFLFMHETSANNAVLECILHATPFVANRHPAIEEYVGKDYPFFIEEVDLHCLTLGQILSLSQQAHEYLKSHATRADLSLSSFASSVIQIAREA